MTALLSRSEVVGSPLAAGEAQLRLTALMRRLGAQEVPAVVPGHRCFELGSRSELRLGIGMSSRSRSRLPVSIDFSVDAGERECRAVVEVTSRDMVGAVGRLEVIEHLYGIRLAELAQALADALDSPLVIQPVLAPRTSRGRAAAALGLGGPVLGALLAFVFGAWLLLAPSDGAQAPFWGMLFIAGVGCIAAGAIASILAVSGSMLFWPIMTPTGAPQRAFLFAILGFVVAAPISPVLGIWLPPGHQPIAVAFLFGMAAVGAAAAHLARPRTIGD